MSLQVTSSAFATGKPIPKAHAYRGEGDNLSPPLAWSGAPEGTRTFALVVDDPDAPSPKRPRPNPWVHWVVFNIPSEVTSLAQGEAGGGQQGTNDFGEASWGGPLPPPGSGVHRYFFRLYALDAKLELSQRAAKADLLAAMEGHVLAEASCYGTYERR